MRDALMADHVTPIERNHEHQPSKRCWCNPTASVSETTGRKLYMHKTPYECDYSFPHDARVAARELRERLTAELEDGKYASGAEL